ncbi:DUF6470 family protein [Paenibacillus sp. 1P07SE]|uniref:DUF6470 family protein n=1 Tax=Paenibacillus sp. 1P07SE TaxID=3132209 RepID=UPI0039A5D452
MNIPQVQIQQIPAKLGMDIEPGRQDLQQPRATMEMEQIRPELSIQTRMGYFEIDQERAWDALALGNNLQTMNKIYGMASNMAMQGLARIVEKGNQMAAIHRGGNAIAELAMDWRRTFPEFDFRGEASVLNVDMVFRPGHFSIDVQDGRVDLKVSVNPPVHNYERGRVNLYMEQYGSVQITPPVIEAQL